MNAEEEGNKLAYDALKHLTTLNTGSIVIVAALLEKLFKNPEWKNLVAVSFTCFVLSIVTAFIAMVCTADRVFQSGEQDNITESVLKWSSVISVLMFLIGIIAFTSFSLKNFLA